MCLLCSVHRLRRRGRRTHRALISLRELVHSCPRPLLLRQDGICNLCAVWMFCVWVESRACGRLEASGWPGNRGWRHAVLILSFCLVSGLELTRRTSLNVGELLRVELWRLRRGISVLPG
jgi:hypothetical protein